jgi:hypothetical protein
LIRRFLPLGVVLLLLIPFVSTAAAQPSGAPGIVLTSQYIVNGFGFVVLNETITFSNSGNSSVQIPSVQVGIPDSIASHSPGFVLSSIDPYTQSSADNGSVTTFTITPGSPTLVAGSSSVVSLKGYISDALNISAGATGNLTALALLSPSFNQKVTALNQDVEVPSGGLVTGLPLGFPAVPGASSQIYAGQKADVTPSIQTQSVKFSDSDQAVWIPVKVYSIVQTLVPSANGVPQVEDTVSLRNLASYAITNLPLKLLDSSVTNVTIVPSSVTPTINPTVVALTNGALNLANPPFSAPIQAGDNFTFAMVYTIPRSDISTSGNTVSVSIPYDLPVQAIVQNYTVTMALPSGMHAVGASRSVVTNATSIVPGTVDLMYTISPGWAADQAVPAATLLFAAAFIALAFRSSQTVSKKEEEEDEDEELGTRLADMIKAMEEKISLFQQFQTDMAQKSQGTVTRNDFNKIRNELEALKVRAMGRLNAVRQAAESQRYVDLLNQLQEAERQEDRAAKDLLNLYDQYQSKRMREETFKRLLPSYKKRLDSATNHLSDLLNLAQREGKQA